MYVRGRRGDRVGGHDLPHGHRAQPGLRPRLKVCPITSPARVGPFCLYLHSQPARRSPADRVLEVMPPRPAGPPAAHDSPQLSRSIGRRKNQGDQRSVMAMDVNPEIAAALAKLAEQDAAAADDAQAALEWIAGDQGLALITRESPGAGEPGARPLWPRITVGADRRYRALPDGAAPHRYQQADPGIPGSVAPPRHQHDGDLALPSPTQASRPASGVRARQTPNI